MTIHRGNKPGADLFKVSHVGLYDPELSWKATGLYVLLSSFDNPIHPLEKTVLRYSLEGVTAIRSGLKELMRLGYLVKARFPGGRVGFYFKESPEDDLPDGFSVYVPVEKPSWLTKDFYRTPEWKVTKEAALARAGHRCARCDSTKQLQVHHVTYERIGNELPEDLEVLCAICHLSEHQGV